MYPPRCDPDTADQEAREYQGPCYVLNYANDIIIGTIKITVSIKHAKSAKLKRNLKLLTLAEYKR